MKLQESENFSLGNFEGPLDLLWHLIHNQELDIYEISLTSLTTQFLERIYKHISENTLPLDQGAEFIATASALVCLKSKTLLPKHEQLTEEATDETDPKFNVIHQLLDYCLFKDAAKGLSDREQQQAQFYFRGLENEGDVKKNLGIQHLSLDDLADLFKHILSKTSAQKGVIEEEVWRVCDKIAALRNLLRSNSSILFFDLFTPNKSREELIVTFLALLELMKSGEALVAKHLEQNTICIFTP